MVAKSDTTNGSNDEEDFIISTETVKNLIFREEPAEIKYPMYRSKFSSMVRVERKKDLDCHRTMGLPSDLLVTLPEHYLKKKTRLVRRPPVEKCDPPHTTGLNRVPKHNEPMLKGSLKDEKRNHVVNNIAKIKDAVPKIGPSRYYDQATNRRYHNCILMLPKYVKDPWFGKVPKYIKMELKAISERKALEEQRAAEQIEADATKIRPPKYVAADGSEIREVTPEERERILEGLKRRWAEMLKEFQLLPMVADTPPQIKRKVRLEKDLAALEKEIDRIDRSKLIYVYNEPQ